LALVLCGLTASPEAATPYSYQVSFTTPGTYTTAIPQDATSIDLQAYGGAGTVGASSPASPGGAGGVGAGISETLPVPGGTDPAGNDVLQVIVGAQGGGGAGGDGNEDGGGGGDGGGATVVQDLTNSQAGTLVVAGGGGGGGGAGSGIDALGGFGGEPTGDGGPSSYGPTSGGPGFGPGGLGGPGGPYSIAGCGTGSTAGGPGGSAGTASDSGGGGGGGDGAAGWAGGGGLDGVGFSGGGGGGAGGSCYSTNETEFTGPVGTNYSTGNGSVIITLQVSPVAVQITSAASVSVPSTARVVEFLATATGSPGPYFSLSGAPSWLQISPTGELSGAIPKGTDGKFTVTIDASNDQGSTVSQPFTLDITAPPLDPVSPSKLTGAIGVPFSTTLQAGGGITPYTWSLQNGAKLPAGLSLSAAGVISGTPTTTATTVTDVSVTDSAIPSANVSTEPVTIEINPRKLEVSTSSLRPALVGSAYSQRLTAAMGVNPLKWSLIHGSLPAGLKLSASTGTISGTPTTAGTSTFKVRVTDSTKLTATATLTLTVDPAVAAAAFVTEAGNSSVQSFALGATGNVAPLTSITSSALDGTSAVAIGANGTVYVASSLSSSIAEFAYDATGNSTPIATITGGPLDYPTAMTIDSSGKLYVADYLGNSIAVYAAGANGNATPVATISGANTGLTGPFGLTTDSAGDLWVANASNDSLTEYPPGANGNVTPTATISGSATGLDDPDAITFDGKGNLLVANAFGSSLSEYPTTDNGNAAPLRTIGGSSTGLEFPSGVDVDAEGNIYVSNEQANPTGAITEYSPDATGDATPTATIAGSATQLLGPDKLAVAPPLSVRTSKLPAARVGARYRARLRAYLGTTPYRWRVIKGKLAPGLKLSSNGVLSGRPKRAGTYLFTIRLRDHSRKAMTATATLELIVKRRR
jgi:hypothetical protein